MVLDDCVSIFAYSFSFTLFLVVTTINEFTASTFKPRPDCSAFSGGIQGSPIGEFDFVYGDRFLVRKLYEVPEM